MPKINFLMPFWSDHVYDDFDEWEETWTSGYDHYKFLWELDESSPMDGVLFSREKFKDSPKRKQQIREAGGIKNFLRIPDDLVLFGDCGAFGYKDEEVPPYDPEETLEFYERMQYDKACTVDHLITGAGMEDKERRQEITLSNAKKMKETHEEKNYSFELYGVAQGWSPDSYYQSVERLLELGFRKIALGGLVGSQTTAIIPILQRCYPLWMEKDVDIHLFGIARWGLFPFMKRYGITSIDNAYHRKAWLDRKNNYELGPDKRYTAIRIPISDQHSDERLPEEQAVFDELRAYIQGDATPKEVVNTLREYEEVYAQLKDKEGRIEIFESLREEYLRTLRDRPWEECDCHICEEYGAHVCVFRRNERNMRRGFHNLYRFYKFFTDYLEGDQDPPGKVTEYSQKTELEELDVSEFEGQKVLVISSCSKTKKTHSSDEEHPAKEIYQGRLFRRVRDLCEATGWDHRILSARYGLLTPEDTVNGYDETLQTTEDAIELQKDVVPDLAEILHQYDSVLLIAGKQYRKSIEPLIDYRFYVIDSAGYPSLCAKIRDAIPPRDTELSSFENES